MRKRLDCIWWHPGSNTQRIIILWCVKQTVKFIRTTPGTSASPINRKDRSSFILQISVEVGQNLIRYVLEEHQQEWWEWFPWYAISLTKKSFQMELICNGRTYAMLSSGLKLCKRIEYDHLSLESINKWLSAMIVRGVTMVRQKFDRADSLAT